MSLIAALNLGASGLSAAQTGIQVTGNNIANAGNANYADEQVQSSPGEDQQVGQNLFLGTGVDITGVNRQVDNALQGRLNNSISDTQYSSTTQQWLTQVQSVFNALGTSNLSSSMSSFFGSWSTLASNPQDPGQRTVVIQQGQALAQQFNAAQQQLQALQTSVSSGLSSQVRQANTLSSQIASLNQQIVVAQGGGSGSANSLLDQRDAAVQSLSQLLGVTTTQQPDGSINVYVGSQPLVEGTVSNGVALQNQTVNGVTTPTVVFQRNNGTMSLNSTGQIGALSDLQGQISGVVSQVNSLAGSLTFELNKVYSSGQGLQGYTSATATNPVADTTQPLNSTAADLPFTPTNGSFVVHVTNTSTGQSTSTLVQVNLTGSPTDTTLDSLTASLNGISGVQASDTGGTLQISSTNPSQQISFSQDSSGTLAALGINTFFTGTDAGTIAVNSALVSNPSLLAAAQDGDPTDNQTALAIAALPSQNMASLGGTSLDGSYQNIINSVANQVAAATSNATAAQAVQNTLQNQRDSLSGVSIDDETINLMKQQQAYQGAAQLINTVNQMMQTLFTVVQ